jgi:hypothetical protein
MDIARSTEGRRKRGPNPVRPPTGAMTIEDGTAIALAYVLVGMGEIIAAS